MEPFILIKDLFAAQFKSIRQVLKKTQHNITKVKKIILCNSELLSKTYFFGFSVLRYGQLILGFMDAKWG